MSADGLRVLEIHRAKAGWFEAPDGPLWPAAGVDAPGTVLFYSFKGGVGRSIALAACALHLASEGDRVVVLDADLDSPGVGSLLGGLDGTTAAWGVVDYLLERPIVEAAGLDLDDYYHRVPSSLLPGGGEILVFPAGTPGGGYVDKLARLDYGVPQGGQKHPFVALQALDDVSSDHVRQATTSEWPWLAGVRTRVKGQRLVPWAYDEIVGLLQSDWDADWGSEGYHVRPPESAPMPLVEYLLELGIFRRRFDGRIDVSDLYLFGLQLRRKGGVRRGGEVRTGRG